MPDSDSEYEEPVAATPRRASSRRISLRKQKAVGDGSSSEDEGRPPSKRNSGTRIKLRVQNKKRGFFDDPSSEEDDGAAVNHEEEYKPEDAADEEIEDSDEALEGDLVDKPTTRNSTKRKKPRLNMKIKLKQKVSEFFDNEDETSTKFNRQDSKKEPAKPPKYLTPPPGGQSPLAKDVPPAVLTTILSFFDVPDLARVAPTCSKLSKATQADGVWSNNLKILLKKLYNDAFKGDKEPIAKRPDWNKSTTFLQWLKDNSSTNAKERKDVVRYTDSLDPIIEGYADSSEESSPEFKWLLEPVGLREYYYRAGKLAACSVQEWYNVYKNTGYCRFCEERNGLNGNFCGLCNQKQDEDSFRSDRKVQVPKIALFQITRGN